MQDTIRVGVYGAGRVSSPDHWRVWLPATYYCTHSMGPVMMVTGTRPVQVNGFVVPYDDWNPDPSRRREGMPFSSVVGDIPVPNENIAGFTEPRGMHVDEMRQTCSEI